MEDIYTYVVCIYVFQTLNKQREVRKMEKELKEIQKRLIQQYNSLHKNPEFRKNSGELNQLLYDVKIEDMHCPFNY